MIFSSVAWYYGDICIVLTAFKLNCLMNILIYMTYIYSVIHMCTPTYTHSLPTQQMHTHATKEVDALSLIPRS